jgi:hypothetical protein
MIEDALFGGRSTAHAVIGFNADRKDIHLRLAPWKGQDSEAVPDQNAEVFATFRNAYILSVDTYEADASSPRPPWDIIGFDSDELSNGRWSFCLHTDCVEYSFESDWPEIVFDGTV